MERAIAGNGRILVTGATGYIGSRLLRSLERRGVAGLRGMTRRPEAIRPWLRGDTECVAADVFQPQTLDAALEGMETAYFLVHSMSAAEDFEERDRRAALNFAEAAARQGLRKIIYLGGLGGEESNQSKHLRSRHEVGRLLASTGVAVLEFRASIVIGSGSLSFEMIRSLVERLPVMVTPSWVASRAQPIAIEDVLAYLMAGLDHELSGHEIVEIGGEDALSYGSLMREYARQRGLRRYMIPVPVLTPRLSSWWLAFVTPFYARIGRRLIDSIKYPTVMTSGRALELFDVRPRGVREAYRRCLEAERRFFRESDWTWLSRAPGAFKGRTGLWLFGRVLDIRQRRVALEPEAAFRAVRRIGGSTGWYYADFLWRLRGTMDRLLGGPGLRPGRADPELPTPGSQLDCWTVQAYEPGRRLRLRADMKLPGRAWLEFRVLPRRQGGSVLIQTAMFEPRGLPGLAYWCLVHPLHAVVFRGMMDGVVAESLRLADEDEKTD